MLIIHCSLRLKVNNITIILVFIDDIIITENNQEGIKRKF
jgi:hypothetical protein